MKYEYLIFNIIIISCPFIVTIFRPQTHLPQFKKTLIAISIPAALFIIWDQIVTGYFWSFNQAYITHIYAGRIPIEEVFFFFTTSYTCLFVWLEFKKKHSAKIISPYIPAGILIVSCISAAVALSGKLWYTFLVMTGAIITICMDHLLKTNIYRTKRSYYFMTAIVCLTALFNSYLTWRPVVIYNRFVKTNIMVGTIPVEDFVYGLVFIISVIILYEHESKSERAHQKA